jgi:hypothetical protein
MFCELQFPENIECLMVLLSGNGRTGETPSQIIAHFWQIAPVFER